MHYNCPPILYKAFFKLIMQGIYQETTRPRKKSQTYFASWLINIGKEVQSLLQKYLLIHFMLPWSIIIQVKGMCANNLI